jgi:hypothetical protein
MFALLPRLDSVLMSSSCGASRRGLAGSRGLHPRFAFVKLMLMVTVPMRMSSADLVPATKTSRSATTLFQNQVGPILT